jgi:hypothetical protein
VWLLLFSLWLARNVFARRGELEPEDVNGGRGGRVESVRRGAGSQWIVAARPLCHLQCPVAYLSRLQRIQPAAHEEGSFEAACHGSSAGQAEPMARALGARTP